MPFSILVFLGLGGGEAGVVCVIIGASAFYENICVVCNLNLKETIEIVFKL